MSKLAAKLNERGVETIIILPENGPFVGPGDGEPILKKNNQKYYLIPAETWIVPVWADETIVIRMGRWLRRYRNFKAARMLADILKREKVDIVHINTSYSYVGLYAARMCRIPVVWHIREFLEEDQEVRIWDKKWGYRVMRKADRVVAISNSIYNKYSKILNPERMRVIFNGIDDADFYRPDRRVLQDDVVRLVYAGGISEKKGVYELLDACEMINGQGYKDRYTLVIVGRGNEESEKRLHEKLENPLLDNVSYIGYQSDMAAVYEMGDVNVVTSRSEAFGRVTVESMMSGNLCLGADAAGTTELIKDGETGFLYACGDAGDMSEKLKYIMDNRERCAAIAKKGQEYMKFNMTADINADNVYKLYCELMGEKKVGNGK
jgi:hypothetical protein